MNLFLKTDRQEDFTSEERPEKSLHINNDQWIDQIRGRAEVMEVFMGGDEMESRGETMDRQILRLFVGSILSIVKVAWTASSGPMVSMENRSISCQSFYRQS